MSASDNIPPDGGERLDSWKAIADYLGRDVRSVQRWEKSRGLPVRRIPGDKGGAVFAYTRELDIWLHSRAVTQPTAKGLDQKADDGTAPEADLEAFAAKELNLPQPQPATPGSSGRVLVLTLIAASLLLVGAVAYFGKYRTSQPAVASPGRVILAVLPFANLNGNPAEDYFADGLTEEMITDVGRINPQSLGVIARTSAMKYKQSGKDIGQIAQELNADYLLEGSVRREGSRARISAQLIRASDQTHMWAETYDVELKDILSVQRDVAAAIATRIRVNLPGKSLQPEPARPANEPAYDAFLKGLYFFGRRDYLGINQAVAAFEDAVQKDSNYAPAYAGLAEARTFVGLASSDNRLDDYQKAQAAAARAIELDDSSAEAHTALAGIKVFYHHDWTGAQTEFQRALELNPNYAHAHHWYANLYLDPQGRFDEAIREMQLAQELDPTNLIINADLGQAYFFARRYDDALAIYKKALAMDPDFLPVHWYLTDCYHQMGRYDEEVQEYLTWLQLDEREKGMSDYHMGTLRAAYRKGGYPAFLQELRRQFEHVSASKHMPISPLTVVYIALGEKGKALQVLESLQRYGAPEVLYLKVHPPYDPLRDEARFRELERSVGLLTP